jgi:hypothetical protein
MIPTHLKPTLLTFLFTISFLPLASALQDVSSRSDRSYIKGGRAAEERRKEEALKTPPADRPDNSITAMSDKAREQFDRNEERNRKRLEDKRDRDRGRDWRRRDRDHDHDNDHSKKRREVPRSILDVGPFVAQAGVPESNRHKIIRDRDHHHHHGNRHHHRHYRYNFYRGSYVYEPATTTIVEYTQVAVLPEGYDNINYGGVTYYYNDGQFYVPTNGEIIEVQPPVGAIVPNLPENSVIIDDNAQTYYVDNGVFYSKRGSGYEVIVPPFGPSEGMLVSGNARDDVFVRLPDSNGGHVEVKLSRTSRGFKGPQGELYSEFPPMEQLQEMYGGKS